MENLELLKDKLAQFKDLHSTDPAYKGKYKPIRDMKRMVNNIAEEGYVGGERGVSPEGIDQCLRNLEKWGF